jgi:hypothetical protein
LREQQLQKGSVLAEKENVAKLERPSQNICMREKFDKFPVLSNLHQQKQLHTLKWDDSTLSQTPPSNIKHRSIYSSSSSESIPWLSFNRFCPMLSGGHQPNNMKT